jgi:GT2 family glycosyltransferase
VPTGDTIAPLSSVAAIVPVWNGLRWLPGCLDSLSCQTRTPDEVIAVDNGSTDGSLELLRSAVGVRVIELGRNTGFAHAVNRGIAATVCDAIALVNTDAVLEADWLARMVSALARDPRIASVACKMLELDDPRFVYDAGDVLRRDGACEQRGRFGLDDGRWDEPGEVFGACAGAALYRRAALNAVGGFDERYFAYLEDVDLALRLRLAGWRCAYEPTIARHAGEGSSQALAGRHHYLVQRNSLLLIGKAFPLRWMHLVAYRQASWLRQAARERRLLTHVRASLAGLAMAARVRRERRELLGEAALPIEVAIPATPIRRVARS